MPKIKCYIINEKVWHEIYDRAIIETLDKNAIQKQ